MAKSCISTSYRTFFFTDFFQISLHCNKGMVMEAVRGLKHYCERTLWHSNSRFGSPHTSRILEPRPKVLISSALNCRECINRTISDLSLSPLFSVLFFSPIIRNSVCTFSPSSTICSPNFTTCFSPI